MRRASPARVLALATTLAATTLGMTACSSGSEAKPAAGGAGRGSAAAAAVPVTTAAVSRTSVPVAIDVIGAAEPYQTVAIHAQVTGAITSVAFKEGDDVQEGQVIFELDHRPLEAALQQARAAVERDLAQEANARASAARYQDLLTRGIATREQADTAKTAADSLAATLLADRAAVDNAAVQLQYATITAPISGRTGALLVSKGNLVRANDTAPLVVINQVAPIYVSFGVPEGRLPELKRYLAQGSVRLEATPPSETVPSEGRVTFIDNAVDAATGQIKVKGSFPNTDHRLWPGQFASVRMTLTTDIDAIVVPIAAVQNRAQGNYVFVVTPEKTATIRNVVLSRQTPAYAVVKEGLAPGEIVVVDGQVRLVAGTKVSIKSGPGGPAPNSASSKVEP
jgi:multidrug efflux system membrane fusion protein